MAKKPVQDHNENRVTRRGFLGGLGAGAVTAVAGLAHEAEAVPEITSAKDMLAITLDINGRRHQLLIEPRWTLLFVLRERLGMTGSKIGCERGECGSCTVLIDDKPRYACMTLAIEAEGHKITTVEGLLDGEELGTVQKAFVAEDAYQCGYCTPGQVMAAEGLLRCNAKPDLEAIRQGMSGNLCRCAAYAHIVKAVDRAATARDNGRKGGAT